MKIHALVLVAALATALLPDGALADGANIGLYTDVSGTTCSFTGNAPGAVTAYVVFRADVAGVNTIQFSAPVPTCLGAVYLGETVTPGMTKFGNSQSGVSILMNGCFTQPASVLQISYMRSGSTDPCCPYPILPDPTLSEISASNCAFQGIEVTSVVAHFNADASCECVGNSPPQPPQAPVPLSGSTGVSVTTALSWFAQDFDNNITAYDVYLGTTPTPPLAASGLTELSYLPGAPLAELTQHYWRVVVRDAFGLEESGPLWTFTTRVANSPPNPPGNPSPQNGAQNLPLITTLGWQASDIDFDPLTYDVYFGTVSPPPLVASNQTSASYTPSLVYGTTYYWRIVVRDDELLETQGPAWAFTTRPSNFPPNAPSNPSPQQASTNQSITTMLSWTGSDSDQDPLTYDIYFGTSATPPLVATNHPTANYSPGTLLYSTMYHWRVVARDPHGLTASSTIWLFSTISGNNPPLAPANPSPSHLSSNISIGASLSWTGSDPDVDPLTYHVYFGTASPPRLAGSTSTPAFTPGLLARNTTYYWNVIADDSRGGTTSSATWSFTTVAGNSPPYPPSSPTPANAANNVARTATLGWNGSDPDGDAVTYRVYFGDHALPPLVAENLTEPSYAPGLLAYGTQYHWRVVVVDEHGDVTSGIEWTFTTLPPNLPPAIPSNPSPPNNSVDQPLGSVLSWTCTDPNGDLLVFDVYFGTASDPPLVAAGHPAKFFDPGPILIASKYYWRIVAHDTAAATSGPTWNFTVRPNAAPNPPFDPWPQNNGAAGLTPLLTWEATDGDGQDLGFDVYFGTTFPLPLAGHTEQNNFSPGALQPGQIYYWQVSVFDGIATTVGPIWQFVARQPGDLVSDGVLTMADAECALDVFLWNTACGGSHAYLVGDVDCSDHVTPRDARCIHQAVVNGSCELCDRAVRPPGSSQRPVIWPVVSVAALSTGDDTLVVHLKVSNIASLDAFGFYAMTDARLRLVRALGIGPANNFAVIEINVPGSGTGVVGGYSLSSHPVDGPTRFVDLYFDISQGIHGDIVIDGFVDALWGASSLYIPLGTTVSAGPPASELTLHQNHPNPFNPQTTISYELPASLDRARVRLSILDVSGRRVATLVDEEQSSGPHVVRWNGDDVRGERVVSGVYFYVLQVADQRRTRKMVLLK